MKLAKGSKFWRRELRRKSDRRRAWRRLSIRNPGGCSSVLGEIFCSEREYLTRRKLIVEGDGRYEKLVDHADGNGFYL